MLDLVERDFFSDHSILLDPYAYFDALREKGPIYKQAGRDYVVVTGFDEALDVLRNTEDFSSAITVQGAGMPLPFISKQADITADIAANRDKFHGGDSLVTMDGNPHLFSRSLISALFTPSRLKANELFIQSFGEELVRNAVAKGGCELIKDISVPFVTLVIADLLGVPEDDRQVFMDVIAAAPPPGSLDDHDHPESQHPLVFMGKYFVNYVADRRANPRGDILTFLSEQRFPDGTLPDVMDIVHLATFLFGAGQDTSAKLLGNCMKFITEQPGLQDQLRANPKSVGAFVEEVLRLEGSTKMTSRLAVRDTKIAGMDIPVGTRVLIALSAANRDPRRWENPNELVLDRPRLKEHVAFGRGAHVCIGAPLARVEVRVILEKFLEFTSEISLDESVHGPRDQRKLDYEPSFIIRGFEHLHLKLTPR